MTRTRSITAYRASCAPCLLFPVSTCHHAVAALVAEAWLIKFGSRISDFCRMQGSWSDGGVAMGPPGRAFDGSVACGRRGNAPSKTPVLAGGGRLEPGERPSAGAEGAFELRPPHA